jgi:ribosome-associated protein
MARAPSARQVEDLIRSRCTFSFARAGGPGGQNVNKVATKAVARLPLSALSFLDADAHTRVRTKLAGRITSEGDLVVSVQDTREQTRNREIAITRMAALIAAAARPPRPRRKTTPSAGSRERRLASKKLRSASKRMRGRAGLED